MKPGVRQVHLVAADRRRNVAGALAHAVALVARPVGQREVADAAAAGVGDQRRRAGRSRRRPAAERSAPLPGRNRRSPSRPASQVPPGTNSEARTRKPPRITAIRTQLRISSVRSMRRPTSRIATQIRNVADADQIDGVGVGRPRQLARRRGRRSRRRRCAAHAGQPDLQEVEHRVEPRPERRRRLGAHEPGEDRLAGRERVAHQLGVEDRLQQDGDAGHPQQRQAVPHEDRGPEQELAAADRAAEDDHAGADHAEPLEPARFGRVR